MVNGIKPKVSVIVCTYNDGLYLHQCINSILKQNYKNIELIIVNDGSTDNTHKIVTSFYDKKIRYFRLKRNGKNIAKVRKFAVSKSVGEFIFMTDGDCWVRKDWIRQGLRAFRKYGTDAIEGKIIYYRQGYHPHLSDRIVSNLKGGLFMTANMAYRKTIFEKVNFNPRYPRLEDRNLALRILMISKIPFTPACVVYHHKKERSIAQFLKESEVAEIKIRLCADIHDKIRFKIFYPRFLAVLFFPPLIFAEFLYGRVRTLNDLKLLPFLYVKAIYIRFLVWKTAIKERVFVI
jgi:glycosyltransferase involved in cell wall biosynthesis